MSFGDGTVGYYGSSESPSFSITPNAVGNFVLYETITVNAVDYATSVSSSNITWIQLVAPTLVNSLYYCTVFIGNVTSTAAGTQTVNYNIGSPILRSFYTEFSNGQGYSAVTLDSSGVTSGASITNYASLTPGHGAGGLYWGYAYGTAGTSAGSTSGYTYALDAGQNGACWNTNCTNTVQAPVWPSDGYYGLSVLLYSLVYPVFVSPPVNSQSVKRASYY